MMNWYDEDPRRSREHHLWYGAEPDIDTAERACVARQRSPAGAHRWYMDAWQTCVQCRARFLFSTEEQRHWYERLRFHHLSYPVRCRHCRAVQRRGLWGRQQYAELKDRAIRRDAPDSLKIQLLASLEAWEAAEPLGRHAVQARAIFRRQIRRRRTQSATAPD